MILLGHGSGGRMSQELVAKHFLPRLSNPALDDLLDSSVVGELALTTDGYVVSPRTFPGGDLGRLAVCGTVNDLCMVGATPLALTAAFILEEGLPLEELDRQLDSMAAAAEEAVVDIVTGDTKVVPRGACDGMFITTSGVGRLDPTFRPHPNRVRVGDTVIVSGSLADHGIAVMASREGLRLGGEIASDVAPLNGLVEALKSSGIDVRVMRDPTRGGAAQSLLEIASAAGVRVVLDEPSIPLKPAVRMGCELLGLDPLYVANEGKLIAVVPAEQKSRAVEIMRGHTLGAQATMIGRIEAGKPGCELVTELGARRTLRMASGELLPRIC